MNGATGEPDVVIVTQSYSGHRLKYARHLIDAALARSLVPIVVGPPGTRGSEEAELHLSEIADAVVLVELDVVSAESVLHVLPPNYRGLTVFLDGDGWLRRLAVRSWPGAANVLIMRPRGQAHLPGIAFAQSVAKWVLRVLVRLRPNLNVYVLVSASASASGTWGVSDPVTFSGTCEQARALRASWASPAVGHWAGVVGSLTERKNVRLLAEALAGLDRPDVGLVLAGNAIPSEEAVHGWLSALEGSQVTRVRVAGPLDDQMFDSVVLALDVVVLAHSNEGPSGVLGKARAAGTRVLAAGARSLRRDALRAPDSITWVPLRRDALASAIADLVDMPRPERSVTGIEEFVDALLGRVSH